MVHMHGSYLFSYSHFLLHWYTKHIVRLHTFTEHHHHPI